MVQYADDTVILLSNENPLLLVQCCEHSVLKISEWFSTNGLTFNTTKTGCMLFCSRQRALTVSNLPTGIVIRDSVIPFSDTIKYLGVTLSRDLSWEPHISRLESKLASNIGIMRKISFFLPKKILYLLYYALIQSQILFCISVWGYTNITQSKRILKSQIRACRIIDARTYSRANDSVPELISDIHSYGILSFCSLFFI